MKWNVVLLDEKNTDSQVLFTSGSYIKCFEYLKRRAIDFITFRQMGEKYWYTIEWYAGGDGFKVIKHYVTHNTSYEMLIEEKGA